MVKVIRQQAASPPHMGGSPYTLQWAALPPKLSLPLGVSGPPANTWFLGSTRVRIPKGISIGSAVFAGLTIVTDHSVCDNRP